MLTTVASITDRLFVSTFPLRTAKASTDGHVSGYTVKVSAQYVSRPLEKRPLAFTLGLSTGTKGR